MVWTVISRNERSTVHAGRFFFAVRCRSGADYSIHEHDQDLAATGSAKELRVFTLKYNVWELSNAVREICGEITEPGSCVQCFTCVSPEADLCACCGQVQPPRHPSTSLDEYRAAMQARHAA
jgi:hypothetical protein